MCLGMAFCGIKSWENSLWLKKLAPIEHNEILQSTRGMHSLTQHAYSGIILSN